MPDEKSRRGRFPEARELVLNLLRAYNLDPDEEGSIPSLARATGFDSRYLYRWYNGEYRPNLDNALELLQRAGLLKFERPVGTVDPARNLEEIQRRNDVVIERLDTLADEIRNLAAIVRERV